ncbi:hypothetical protein ACMU_06595 [Actibacterium mucosum KCTC 23349]|uniref:peptide-methionine (R)-S-oxide reductase n=1 Tax=Actibacterium mucosum KCTC 23349 TaxID=1454373 RepID=A0A037ZM35_9RHOB|nr:peptide-methionine (R)-S-oxide reductase [Actibacterium mucosum]KAJ56607.1 hypothetical protein ACMU_06595 [Actibacterium mucosum KCTC 23349]
MAEDIKFGRRAFLGSAAMGAAGLGAAPALASAETGYSYEVQRSDAEWRAMLTDEEYGILREGQTEQPRTSLYWADNPDGTYHCKGCDLHVYSSEWKVVWKSKGWVFFRHSEGNATMTAIDRVIPPAYGGNGMANPNAQRALIETHCRRCGSHLGHTLMINLMVIHCINGKALNFRPVEA